MYALRLPLARLFAGNSRRAETGKGGSNGACAKLRPDAATAAGSSAGGADLVRSKLTPAIYPGKSHQIRLKKKHKETQNVKNRQFVKPVAA